MRRGPIHRFSSVGLLIWGWPTWSSNIQVFQAGTTKRQCLPAFNKRPQNTQQRSGEAALLSRSLPFFRSSSEQSPPMAPKSDSTEAIVLNFVTEQNKPLNSQNVADALQKFNLKKGAIQKALDTLADSGRISFKEYGKQKIYLARQDQFDIPDSEELARMKEENAQLQEKINEQKKELSSIEGEIKALQSNLTLEEIRAREVKLRKEVVDMEVKLAKLREGVTLVSPEERKAVEGMFTETMNQWRRRKRMFKDIWDAITENSPKDLKEFKEELGIEYDEDVGVSLQSFEDLRQQGKKRARGL